MSYRILVPLDGSAEGESALKYTQMLATRTKVSVELLRCFELPATIYTLPDLEGLGSDVLGEHSLQTKMLAYLDQKKAELAGVECEARVVCGDPAGEIVERGKASDMIVISRHGRRGVGRWLLGSITTKVARSSARPVLVVPGMWCAEPRLDRIMVCLDGSETAEKGLETAATLARAVKAKLVLYRFVPLLSAMDPEGDLLEAKSYIQERREAYSELVSEIFVQPGAMSEHIAQSSEELDIDLVVLGSHSRQGIARWLLGSVAEHALHHVKCPVLIVPQKSQGVSSQVAPT